MKALMYITKRSFINFIKDLKNRPAALIGYLAYTALLIFLIVGSLSNKKTIVTGVNIEIYGAIVTAVILSFLGLTLVYGAKNGGTFFRKADVNFVFPSPISSTKVLFYGLLKESKSVFIMVVLLLFQIPLIKRSVGLVDGGIWILILGVVLFTINLSLLQMIMYSISCRSDMHKKIIKRTMDLIMIVFGIFIIYNIFKYGDIFGGVSKALNCSAFMYIPVIGWYKQIFMSAVTGIDIAFILNVIVILAFISLLIYVIYKLDNDFYEDVLKGADILEEQLKIRKEGKGDLSVFNKDSKVRKVKLQLKGKGASAIFYRQLGELKKSGWFFVNKRTLIFFIIAFVYGKIAKTNNLEAILYFTLYMHFIFSANDNWTKELSKPYIYLIPDSSIKKIIFATLADTIKNFIDGFVIFITAGVLVGADIITMILCGLTYGAFGAVFIYGNVLFVRIFSASHSQNLKAFLRMILILLILVPGIILSVVMRQMIGNYSQYFVLIIYNLVISLILIYSSKAVFENCEIAE